MGVRVWILILGCLWPEQELENSSLAIRTPGLFSYLFRERANYFQINFHYSFSLTTLTFPKGTKQIIHYEIFDLKQNIRFTLCGHLVRQHIVMKTRTCNLLWKDVPAFRKITGFRVLFPGEEHLGSCGCHCTWVCPQSFLNWASPSWENFYWSAHNVSLERGNIFLFLTFGKTVAGADPVPECSNILLSLQLKLILRQFLLFPDEKKIFTSCKMQLLICL